MSAFANVSSANTETANRNKQGAKLLRSVNKKSYLPVTLLRAATFTCMV